MADRSWGEFWKEFWANVKDTWAWMAKKLVAPGVAVLIVIGAIILVAMGCKELQIGGLLAKLFGKDVSSKKKVLDVVNSTAKKRVDANGNAILPGTPDSKGQTQVQVVSIDSPGLFSNPDTVTFTPPGEDKPVEVVLPDGVKNRDVESVLVVKPGEFAVTVKDSSPVKGKALDDLLSKYGGGS